MITAGSTANGMMSMRAAPEARTGTAVETGAATGAPPADEGFGELLTMAAAVDPTAALIAPDPGDTQRTLVRPPMNGNIVPGGGSFLPHLIQSFTDPRAAAPGAIPTLALDLQQAGAGHTATVLTEALERRVSSREANPEFLLQHASSPETLQRAATPANVPGSAALTPGQPGFDQALGQRLVMMVQQGMQHARVNIHPEHLGPLEIRVKLDAEGAHVVLQSPHAAVREVLEQALPRLREVLGEGGLELVDVDIGDPEQQASERDPEAATQAADRAEPDVGDEGFEPPAKTVAAPRGLLDTFA
ncbi:MAG: flagellar hook-length control protein FliK [Gammaproteobacteria bacterium]|nr:MAG: flagellar hook-length control protein FliK [Gammaproteobacteria bacterium]